ncbi:hypothetical protein AAF712_000266 [Marasmius tenuissimus]|uniref:Non-haem dioxygenase N-terminal domain-containing protein n=1 Tax=Marasmius tenuissimus TaxID=585030 RepID=A0ABR3AG02_9AGAR
MVNNDDSRNPVHLDGANPPGLTPWNFASETACIPEEEYVELEVIDLSAFRQYDSEASGTPLSLDEARAQEKLIERARDAFRSVGFVAMHGHGLNAQDIQHQFDLARLLNVDVSEEEKRRLHARIAEEGSWAGYKPCGYYNRPDGSYDNIEVCILILRKSNNLVDTNDPKHYDLYPFTALKSRLPEVAQPFLDDIRQFMEVSLCSYVSQRRVYDPNTTYAA